VVVTVVVAGVISVGHADEDVYGDDRGNDHDHHPPVPLAAGVRRGKMSPSAAFHGIAAPVSVPR